MAKGQTQKAPLGEILTRDFLMLSTINLCVFFGFQMLNVGLPVYMAQLGATAQVVGLATTLMTIMATVMRVFSGALLDRFGRMGMLVGGTAITACAIISFAVFPVVGIILGFRMLHGIGWGMGSTALSTIAADIIPKHRFAEGMGYFAMTIAISSAVSPAVSIMLVQDVSSTAMIYVAAGITVFALVLAVAEALLGRRDKAGDGGRIPDGAPSTAGASDAGAERPGGEAAHDAAVPGPAERDAAAPGPAVRDAAAHPKPPSKLEALFERRAVVPGILILLVNIGFGCITTFIALHADSQGVEGVSAYFVVYAVVTLASRPYIGKLIDRYGYRIPAILSTLCTAGTLALIGASSNIWMFAGAGALGGLGIGTAMGTFQTMAVANVEPWRRGVATSTYMTAFDLGIVIGSLVGGVIVEAVGYGAMYFAIALFPLAASIMSALVIKVDSRTR